MAVTPKVVVDPYQVAAAEASIYISPSAGKGTIIDKCSATNTTGVAATITIRLVKTATVFGVSNTVLFAKSIAANETYTCPEVVGHVLNPGDFISVVAGTAAAITLRISGRELT
jgi:hypothetical protein